MKITKNFNVLIVIMVFLISVFLLYSNVQAASITTDIGTINAPQGSFSDLGSGVQTVMNGLITVGQIAFIVLFLVGGVMYLTSMGNEEQAGKARKLLIDAIIGLVIVMAAWAVSTWVLGSLSGQSSNTGTNTGTGATSLMTRVINIS